MIRENTTKNVSFDMAIEGIESWGYIAEHDNPHVMYANLFNPISGENNYSRFDYDTNQSCYTFTQSFKNLDELKGYLINKYGEDGKYDVWCWLTDVVREVATSKVVKQPETLMKETKNNTIKSNLNKNVLSSKASNFNSTSNTNLPNTASVMSLNETDAQTETTADEEVSLLSFDEATEIINKSLFEQEQKTKQVMNNLRGEYNRIVKDKLDKGKFTVVNTNGDKITIKIIFTISCAPASGFNVTHLDALKKELKEQGVEADFTPGRVSYVYDSVIEYTVTKKK